MAESEAEAAQIVGFCVMIDEAVQADEEVLSYQISDEALETAAGNEALPAITMFCTGIGCPVLGTRQQAKPLRLIDLLGLGLDQLPAPHDRPVQSSVSQKRLTRYTNVVVEHVRDVGDRADHYELRM
jgi:hypothetical protein